MKTIILEVSDKFNVNSIRGTAKVIFSSSLLNILTIEIEEPYIQRLNSIPGILSYRESEVGRVQLV